MSENSFPQDITVSPLEVKFTWRFLEVFTSILLHVSSRFLDKRNRYASLRNIENFRSGE